MFNSNNNPLFAAVSKVTGAIGIKGSTPPPPPPPPAAPEKEADDLDNKKLQGGDDDDVDEDDDLSGILRNMDIDRDFNALRSSTIINTATTKITDNQDNVDAVDAVIAAQKDLSNWKSRWQGRDEIFSSNYRPSTTEEQDMQRLAESVGIIVSKSNPLASVQHFVSALSPKSDNTTTATLSSMTTEQVTRLLLVDGSSQGTTPRNTASEQPPMGHSIVLQRGTVMVSSSTGRHHHQRELVIVTHGFILLEATTTTAATTTTESDDNTNNDNDNYNNTGCCTELPISSPPGGWLSSLSKLPSWNTGDGGSSNNTTISISATVDAAHLWQHVTLVQVGVGVVAAPNTFVVHVQEENKDDDDDNDDDHDDISYTFLCGSAAQKEAWLDVLELVVLQAYQRFVVPSKVTTRKSQHQQQQDDDDDDDDDEEEEEDETWSLGWQHRIVQRSLHAPAVTGNAQVLQQMLDAAKSSSSSSSSSSPPRRPGTSARTSYPPELLDPLDTYQSWTPLHYAAYHNHVAVAKILLNAGADPNIVEGTTTSSSSSNDGRTPLYLSERYRFAEMKTLLESHGARPSTMARNEERGALFRSVAAVEEKKKIQKEQQQQQQAAAAAAQEQQNHAMQALRERGQKIEQLDDKTQELQQNAHDYRDMAKTLKDHTMQKKWYQM